MSNQMTPLRRRMIDDMAIQHVAEHAEGLHPCRQEFQQHFGKSPDKLTFEDVRTYQLHLVSRGLQGQHLSLKHYLRGDDRADLA